MTDVDALVVREGKNAKGRVVGLLLSTVAAGVLAKALANTVKAVEGRASAAPSNRG